MSETLQAEPLGSERPQRETGEAGEAPLLAFGRFELDQESGELLREGERVKLQPQPFRVLQMLAEKAGRVVSREELREEIWGDAFVDWEAGLNLCILQIRRALGDKARDPDFVETLPRRGYRFLPRVEERRREAERPASTSLPGAGSDPAEEAAVALSESELEVAVAAGAEPAPSTGALADDAASLPAAMGGFMPAAQRAPVSLASWWPTLLLILGFAYLAGQMTVQDSAVESALPTRVAAASSLADEAGADFGGSVSAAAADAGARWPALLAASPAGRVPMSTIGKAEPSLRSSAESEVRDGVCAVFEASLPGESECDVQFAAASAGGSGGKAAGKPDVFQITGTVLRTDTGGLSIQAQLTPVDGDAAEAPAPLRKAPANELPTYPVGETRVAAKSDGGSEECKALGRCLDAVPEVPTRIAVPTLEYAQPTSEAQALPGFNMPAQ